MAKFNDEKGTRTYYWYNGEKQYLTPNPNKHFILFSNMPKDSDIENFGYNLSKKDIHEFKLDNLLTSYIELRELKSYWSIINGEINLSSKSPIDYYTPFFIGGDGKEVGLSHLFYVKLSNKQDSKVLEELAKDKKVKVLGHNQFMPLWYTLSCDKESEGNALEMANLFYETGYFEASQPDLMEQELLRCVNDTYFYNQWGLRNTGQYGGTPNSDIKICNARTLTEGCEDIIVAVLDHGIETNHPDLPNISQTSFDAQSGTSPSQIRGNHCTAVAGIIGAKSNNNIGIAGIAPKHHPYVN